LPISEARAFLRLQALRLNVAVNIIQGPIEASSIITTWQGCFNRSPWFAFAFQKLVPNLIGKLIENARKHEAYTLNLIKKYILAPTRKLSLLVFIRRVKSPIDRADFLSRILDSGEKYNLSDIQIAAHASDFIIAGSETTATALSCITYHLLKNNDITRKIQQEIRSAFNSYDETNSAKAAQLKYLTAVCLEGMRIYPPLPFS
jgi:cytochrome P450